MSLEDEYYMGVDPTPEGGNRTVMRSPELNAHTAAIIGGFGASAICTGILISKVWNDFWENYNNNEGLIAAALLTFGLGNLAVYWSSERIYQLGPPAEDGHTEDVVEYETTTAGKIFRAAGVTSVLSGAVVAFDWIKLDEGSSTDTSPTTTVASETQVVEPLPANPSELAVVFSNEPDSDCAVLLNLNTAQLPPDLQEHVGTHARYWQYWLYINGGFDQFGATEATGTDPISPDQQRQFITGNFRDQSNQAVDTVRAKLGMPDGGLDEALCLRTPYTCIIDPNMFSRMPQLQADYVAGGSQARGCLE